MRGSQVEIGSRYNLHNFDLRHDFVLLSKGYGDVSMHGKGERDRVNITRLCNGISHVKGVSQLGNKLVIVCFLHFFFCRG